MKINKLEDDHFIVDVNVPSTECSTDGYLTESPFLPYPFEI
jgi:hypothetical protein